MLKKYLFTAVLTAFLFSTIVIVKEAKASSTYVPQVVALVSIYNYPDFLEPGKKKDAKVERLAPGAYDLTKGDLKWWNNRISSIKIPPGYLVTMFENVFSGKTGTLTKDDDQLGKSLNNKVSSIVITEPAKNINTNRINFVGTRESVSPEQLKDQLNKMGRKLVNKDTLDKDECTIVYGESDRKDLTAEFGMLTCNYVLGDGTLELSAVAVYGGSDIAQKGVGSACEVGIFKSNLTINGPGGYKNTYEVKGPNAKHCSAISKEMTCMSAGANLAEASTEISDKHGNAIGGGVSAGLGAGLDTKMDGWTVSSSIDLKLGVGAKINFSVNLEKDGKAIYKVGKVGYVKVKGEIEGAANRVFRAFPTDKALKGARELKKGILGTWKDGKKEIIKVAKDTKAAFETLGKGSTWESAKNFFDDVADGFCGLFGC